MMDRTIGMDGVAVRELLGDWREGPGRPAEQLASRLTALIATERLPAGVRLPAERRLAEELELSRGTVVRAYARLRDDELVHTRHGSGTIVGRDDHAPGRAAALAGALSTDASVAALVTDVRGGRDDMIDLRTAAWYGDRRLIETLRSWETSALLDVSAADNGYWPLGLPLLRRQVADRLSAQGLATTPDQIVITNGAQQALDVVLTTMANPGDSVVVAEVTWPGIRELLTIRGQRPAPVPLAADGAIDQVELLRVLREGRSPLAYLVPSFDNPTGVLMPASTRRLVVEAARAGGTTLIDDVTMHELWLDEPPPPPLAATVEGAGAGVLTIGSLSKVAWAGIRLGWIRAEGAMLERLGRGKTVLDFGTSVPSQLAACVVMEQLDDVVAGYRDALRVRRRAVLDALAEYVPAWSVTPPKGGLTLWVDLAGVSSDRFVARAAAHGVRLVPGRVYHALGRDTGHIRLTMCHDEETTREAVRRLAGAWEEHLGADEGRRIALV
jgi:DNA-binding transcriptional MocR family regulator